MVTKSFDIGTAALLPFAPGTVKLALEWAPLHVHVCLWNTQHQRCEAVESFNGDFLDAESLEIMKGQSRLLHLSEVPVLLLSAGPRVLPMPDWLFTPKDAEAQLELLYGKAYGVFLGADVITDHQMTLAWQMPAEVKSWAEANFDLVQTQHLAAVLLHLPMPEGIAGQVLMSGKEAWLLFFNNKQLIFAGWLPVLSADDLAYRLLNIARQHHIEAADVQWQISGMIEADGNLYKGIEKYLQQISITAPMAEAEGNQPLHYFNHLFQILS